MTKVTFSNSSNDRIESIINHHVSSKTQAGFFFIKLKPGDEGGVGASSIEYAQDESINLYLLDKCFLFPATNCAGGVDKR